MTTIKIAQPTSDTSRSSIFSLMRRYPLAAYFVLAFALMWVFALPMALSRNAGVGLLGYELSSSAENVLFLLATFSGPTIAALIVTAVTEGTSGVGGLLKRFVQWRVGAGWYVVALLVNLVIWLLSYSLLMGPQLLAAAMSNWTLLFSTFLPLVAFGIVLPSIAEEPGWRGFALPRLQQRYGALVASLILGLLHGLWHLPALMTTNFGPLPSANYVPFMLTAILATLLYTWVYNQTEGSVLVAMVMHASSNATSGWLTTLMDDAGLQEPQVGVAGFLASSGWINVIAYAVAALLLVVLTRGRLGEDTRSS